MSASLVANVTVTGNLSTVGTSTSLNVQTMNVASGFSINNTIFSNVVAGTADFSTGARTTSVSIANGYQFSAVLLANGTVRTFGYNSAGQIGNGLTPGSFWYFPLPTPVFGITTAVDIAAGFYHLAIVLENGTVRTVGGNVQGQLGIGDTVSRLTPVQVPTITSATAVACGRFHTLVLLSDGTVRSFGFNSVGQLGVNDTTQRPTPVPVLNITSATAVSGGNYHSSVILVDKTVWTFGRNAEGQLGVNDTTSRLTPVQVLNITSASVIARGSTTLNTAVILSDGTVRTWGSNNVGQLGVNDTTNRSTPVQVLNITSAAAIAYSGSGSLGLVLTDGTVRTCGYNLNGQLGVNDTTSRLTPVQVWGISSTAVAVAGGGYHTSVILSNGTIRTFGRNDGAQLGLIDGVSRLTPVQVLYIPEIRPKVSGGQNHTAIVLNNGSVLTVGRNDSGQLGVGDTVSRLTPVSVPNITSALSISCGRYHTAIVLTNGTVWTFGSNASGQLGVNDTTSRLTPVQVWGISSTAVAVACGVTHTIILHTDGTVRGYGTSDSGELGGGTLTGGRLTPVQMLNMSWVCGVAAGLNYTIVLRSNGTVWACGAGGLGGTGLNDTTSRLTPVQVSGISSSAVAVACGYRHTSILLSDGTIRVCGSNVNGELGTNDTLNRSTPVQTFGISSSAISISNGRYYSAILLANGTILVCGLNGNGQLGINATTSRLTPVQVWGISSTATAIGTGWYHSAVILSDGTLRTSGLNNYGQLSVNDTTSRLTPVIALGFPSLYTVCAPSLSLGLASSSYQLDLSKDGARKLTTSTWLTGSDKRIKTDIESANLARCVEIVDSLDLKYFKWNYDEVPDRHSLGWIAQDVKEFFPKSIRLTEDHGLPDFHNLDSDQLIKTMYGALKKMVQDTYPPQLESPSSDSVPEPSQLQDASL